VALTLASTPLATIRIHLVRDGGRQNLAPMSLRQLVRQKGLDEGGDPCAISD
jgi:hypothetical protein